MRFENKVAAITGGGSGIGFEVAKRLAAEGAKVVINGRDRAKLDAAAAAIGGEVAVFAGDIADPKVGQALVQTAVDRFGALDILVNNAGVFRPKPFLELTQADIGQLAIAELRKLVDVALIVPEGIDHADEREQHGYSP